MSRRKENQITINERINQLSKWDLELILLILLDVDNYVKFYMDCMNKLVYLDDSQVIELRATKEYSDKESYTEIII